MLLMALYLYLMAADYFCHFYHLSLSLIFSNLLFGDIMLHAVKIEEEVCYAILTCKKRKFELIF